MATSFIVARRGVHDELRQEFCHLRERVYCEENPWEIPGSEVDQHHFDPWDYLLIIEDGVVVGGCILVDSTPPNTGGKELVTRQLVECEIEISRNINTANLGFRGLIPFYFQIFQWCVANGVTIAYADMRSRYYKAVRRVGFLCVERMDGEETGHGVDTFVPVRITANVVASFFAVQSPEARRMAA